MDSRKTAFVSTRPSILVVDDIKESRDGIERLLRCDGYAIETVRSESGAIKVAARSRPQLVLINLGSAPNEAVATARRIRQTGVLDRIVPIVLFCIEWSGDGENVAVGDNIYVAHPDNFDQLRDFFRALLVNSS